MDKHPPGTQFYEAASRCIDKCEGLVEDLHPFLATALRIYSMVNDQVLVAGMGEVIGLNQLAIHAYMERQGYGELEYQLLFDKVVDISKKMSSGHRKYSAISAQSDAKERDQPKEQTPRTISRQLRPPQN